MNLPPINFSRVLKLVIVISLPLIFVISFPLHGSLVFTLTTSIGLGYIGFLLFYVVEAILALAIIILTPILAYIFFKRH